MQNLKEQEILTYEEFKTEVLEKLTDYMPKEYSEKQLSLRKTQKINMTKEGIVFSNMVVSPTIYISDMYEMYLEHKNLEDILNYFADIMVKGDKEKKDLPDIKFSKDKVIFQLINTEKNKELLRSVPHRTFLDLSIIYRVVLDNNERNLCSCMVTNELMKIHGFTEEELFSLAKENTKRILPPTITDMTEILFGYVNESNSMWVLSNSKGVFGATSILFEETLHTFAEDKECDFCILPSSIHETILIPVDGHLEIFKIMKEMVETVNVMELSETEILSWEVYFYDRKSRKISLMDEIIDNKKEEFSA